MIVYLDESGDTGWKFDQPYGHGGSSRYLTIAMLLVPNGKQHLPKRIIKNLYLKTKTPTCEELKGFTLGDNMREWYSSEVEKLIHANPDIRLCAITVNKQKVAEHIRRDNNKLYNYMIKLCLLDKIKDAGTVDFNPDPRSIKVASGSSLVDYLNTVLWMEMGSTTTIFQHNTPSNKNLNIQFVDVFSNIIWRKYEFGEYRKAYRGLDNCTELHKLYFPI